MTSLHAYSKYPWRHFLIFKIPMTSAWIFIELRLNTQITHEVTLWITMTSLREYSKDQLLNFQNTHGVSFRIFKLMSDKVTSWKYWKADVMGILEYSWSDVMVFWIFKRSVILNMWPGYFEYSEWHWYFEYSKKSCSFECEFLNTYDVSFWIFP